MFKVSFFRSETGLGSPVAVPICGPNLKTATASPALLTEVNRYIGSLRPSKDSIYVLVNAMGAGEYYGSNINGDYFSEACLIHAPDNWAANPLLDKPRSKGWPYGYPTFYEAHPFAHHRNKDPKRAYGDVELAAWNPKMRRVELVVRVDKDKCERFAGVGVWDKLRQGQYPDVSMGCKVPFDTCFPALTLVRTDAGHVPIESIQVGDRVLTHLGRYAEVTRLMRRTAQSRLRIRAAGLPVIEATENHPFLVVRCAQARSCKGTVNGQRVRHSFELNETACRRCEKAPSLDLVWAAAETLTPGDYLAVPVCTAEKLVPVALPLARLLGYYLGNGYVIKQKTGKRKDGEYRDMGVGFSFGSDRPDNLQKLLSTILESGAANEPHVYDAGCERKAHIISVYDQALATWVQEFGGRTSRAKRLHEKVFAWSEEAKLELIAGYIDTDGSFDEPSGKVRISSVNRGLLLDAQRLLLSLGLHATICSAGAGSNFGVPFKCWFLCLSAAQAQKFYGRSVKVKQREVGWDSPQTFFWGGYWLTPIKSVEALDDEVEVFNLSVAGDESYIAEGRAVHNCSICLDWDAYRKAQATFDPDKHTSPGQAVLAFHKTLKQRNGHGIRGLSITRVDYCEHAKRSMNRILPDGRKVFVYNDYPKFFDISFVFIGADKTAKVMLKIADSARLWSLPSAELAEKLGYDEVVEGATVLEKVAGLKSDLLKAAFLGKAAKEKESEITKEVLPSPFAEKAVPLLTEHEPSLPPDVLEMLGAVGVGPALSTTAGLGIVLRPREFQRIILIASGDRAIADLFDDTGTLFQRALGSAPPPLAPSLFSPALARLLLPLLACRSALGPAIEKRILVLPEHNRARKKKGSSLSSPRLDKIGAAYNGYRTGLMELVANAQQLVASAARPSDFHLFKIAEAPVEEVFTPLSLAYLRTAHLDELESGHGDGGSVKASQAQADVERVSPSRNTWTIPTHISGVQKS